MDQYSEDLKILLHLCFRLIQSESNKDIVSGNEWKNDAQVLATKLFRHIASAEHINEGLAFDYGREGKFRHLDHSSVAVLIRAAIECYLTFNYLFANDDDKVSIYRHRTWALGGLIDRSTMFSNHELTDAVIAREGRQIVELKELIKADPLHALQNRDRRRDVLKGKWRPAGGWNTLGADADINAVYFNDIYNHLSGHAHASFISALQIRDALTFEQQKSLAAATRANSCLTIAHFAFSYVKCWPKAQVIFAANKSAYDLASSWYVRASDVDHIYSKDTTQVPTSIIEPFESEFGMDSGLKEI